MYLDSYDCVMCQDATEETLEHMFLECPFANDCWNLIGINIQTHASIFSAIQQIKNLARAQFFMIVAILMCRCIWSVRNDLIFKGIPQNLGTVKAVFSKELKILTLRAKAKFASTFDLWIQNLL
jgi:hypothetical protein